MEENLSVSEFNTLIKTYLEELGVFRVRGEITEFTVTQRKGVYITISDGKANLKVGGYYPNIKGIDLIEKGMTVIVSGSCDIYVPYGNFNFSAFSIEPDGEGSMSIAYQKLKEKLDKEGLFSDVHKLKFPKYITKIALLTGKDSAAYSDFVKILHENHSGIEVDFFPVIVQGDNSVESILNILKKIKKKKEYDVVVLTRGGGSLEDLKSFNDENIAREIFSSEVPVLVGVGHEKDESIADFVADVRASTPSQCAFYILEQNSKFIDSLIESADIIFESVYDEIRSIDSKSETIFSNISNYIENQISELENKLESYARLIKSFDLGSTLKRGFAVVEKKEKRVKSISDLSINDDVSIRIYDGSFESKIIKINSK